MMSEGARWAPTATLLMLALVFGGNSASGQTSDLEETPLVMTLDELQGELARREADLARYGERLDALERQNGAIRQRVEEHEQQLLHQERNVRDRIVTLCRLTRGGYVQLLGGARTWVDLMRRAQLVRAIVERDVAALREHQEAVAELARRREELSNRVETQRRLSERINQYRQELELELERQRRHSAAPSALPQSSPFDELPSSGSFDSLDL